MAMRADFERNVYCVMGLPIDAMDMPAAVAGVRSAAFAGRPCFISTPNLNFVMAARTDPAFRASVLSSDMCLADGMPLVWVARLLGYPIRERVSGAGLFESLMKHPGPPVSVYIFGGPEGAAEAASDRINQTGGGLRCVGFDAAGFGNVEDMSSDAYIDKINRSGAQFVIVSLGAKKGQAWIMHNRARLKAPVVCHLGAVVNFAAGTIRRAPRWVQAVGAEWLWRIKEEPALWRRYWADGASLVRELLMNVLPLMVQRHWIGWKRPMKNVPTLSVSTTDHRTKVNLEGDWCQEPLGPIRAAFNQAQSANAELVVDLSATTGMDGACMGLFMLAKGASCPQHSLRLTRPSQQVAQTIGRAGAAFLLTGGGIYRGEEDSADKFEPGHSP